MTKLLKVEDNQIVNTFLLLIASTLIFRKLCTIIILLFFIYSLFSYKHFYKKELKQFLSLCLVISIPFLLEVFFFWNNDSMLAGQKSIEKNLSCIVFPYLIISHYQSIDFLKLLKRYSIITIVLLVTYLCLFIILEPSYFNKYMHGIDLWEMGYVFSKFIGPHAPALNLYISFISTAFLYFFLSAKNENKALKTQGFYFAFFLLAFFFLLVINTRIALLMCLINAAIVFNTIKIELKKKLIIIIGSLLLLAGITKVFVDKFPFTVEKYTSQIFKEIDKVGKLDEIKDPEKEVYSSLVTRLSIWKSAYELSKDHFLIGVGSSDAADELTNYYKKTNQVFLAKYSFITHNQFLNFFLKYGIVGLLCCFIYLFYPLYISIQSRNILFFCFFLNFLISNLTDDYLNKFDGIAYSAFWYSIFTAHYLALNKNINEKNKNSTYTA